MIERKKKLCVQCLQEKYIFSKGRCEPCSKLVSSSVNKLKKKEKKESISELKKKLDDVFSKYTRLRNADDNGMVKCFTSDKIMHWTCSQAGHFISRRKMGTRWNEINVQVQSVAENCFNQGNAPEFGRRIIEQFGIEEYEKLFQLAAATTKYNKLFYTSLIDNYTEKVNELLNRYERHYK